MPLCAAYWALCDFEKALLCLERGCRLGRQGIRLNDLPDSQSPSRHPHPVPRTRGRLESWQGRLWQPEAGLVRPCPPRFGPGPRTSRARTRRPSSGLPTWGGSFPTPSSSSSWKTTSPRPSPCRSRSASGRGPCQRPARPRWRRGRLPPGLRGRRGASAWIAGGRTSGPSRRRFRLGS